MRCDSEFDLANQLTNVFMDNFSFDPDVELSPVVSQAWTMTFSPLQVFHKLSKIKNGKAAGPDMISSNLVKLSAHYICEPLCAIYNKSIEQKVFPSAFKVALVTPVPKKMKPTIKDFRPIALLPIISKVFEQLVLDGMRDSLVACYSPTQHAYKPYGSTVSALVQIHDTITQLIDCKDTKAVRVICVDLSKAFDALKFHRLLNYLLSKGLNGGFIEWLSTYLSGRTIRVKVKDALGPQVVVPSGVPQGSVLGPYLFAAYMGSICFSHHSAVAIQYADDVTIIEAITSNSINIPIRSVEERFSNAGLHLNYSKCKEMHIRCSRAGSNLSVGTATIANTLKILGVTLSDSLSWSNHFSDLLKRASRRLYIIRSLKPTLSKRELISVYHSVITSIFLYAAPAFGHIPKCIVEKIERFQRRAHRIICGTDCTCDFFPLLSDKIQASGLKFLQACENSTIHPLHDYVPERLQRTGLYRLSVCATSRRQHSFFPWYCLIYNNSLCRIPSCF